MHKKLLFGLIAIIAATNAYSDQVLTSQAYVDNADALKVNIAQGVGTNNANVGKTLVVNSSGNLELGTVSADNFVEDSITDGVTNMAPSENAVHDALENKQNKIPSGTAGDVVTYSGTAGTVGSVGVLSSLDDYDSTTDSEKLVNAGAIVGALSESDVSNHTINGAPLSNAASVFYGTSSTAAATAIKEVSIPSITTLSVGTMIIVQPSVTSTVANSSIKLNNFDAYPMRYNNAAITTSTDSVVWSSTFPSIFVFDGTYWRFVAHGYDTNTTYSVLAVADGIAGTATAARTISAANAKQIIQGTTLTGIDTTATTAVVATDSITTGIGKLQGQVDTKQNKMTCTRWLPNADQTDDNCLLWDLGD